MRAVLGLSTIFIIMVSLYGCQSAVSERSFTSEVIHGLSQNGMAYVRGARQNGGLQRIMHEIAQGNGMLIDNAYIMRRSLEENEELELQNALALALKNRPDKVLALMPAHYAYDDLCSVPASVSADNKQQYIEDAIQVLSTAATRFKARQQRKCLARFETLRESV